ncbi:MAG: cell division protein FtsQ/DivIB, partial [Chitinophagaceae bacterium]
MHIHVENKGKVLFVNKEEIRSYIIHHKSLNPIGKQLSNLNIHDLTEAVSGFPWVKGTEVYVDNDNVLQVNITECEPVARVFANNGTNFYLGNDGKALPVNGNFAIRMPVFTGFPLGAVSTQEDSSLLAQMINISQYISKDPFWSAQIAQININANNQFELIPMVGNALIEIGRGDSIEEKLNNLIIFYRKGLNNVGWGYYDTLDLRYKGQVIATRKSVQGSPVVDSIMTEDGYKNADSGIIKNIKAND